MGGQAQVKAWIAPVTGNYADAVVLLRSLGITVVLDIGGTYRSVTIKAEQFEKLRPFWNTFFTWGLEEEQ